MSDQPFSPTSYAPVQLPAIEVPNYLRWHWALVMLGGGVINVFIRGSYSAWLLVQANWVRKVTGYSEAYSKAMIALVLMLASWVVGLFTGGLAGFSSFSSYNNHYNNGIGQIAGGITMATVVMFCLLFVLGLAALVFYIVAAFALRRELEAAPFYMRLSGPMTFFFNSIYFQYHFNQWGLPGQAAGQPAVYASRPPVPSEPPPPPPAPYSAPPPQA